MPPEQVESLNYKSAPRCANSRGHGNEEVTSMHGESTQEVHGACVIWGCFIDRDGYGRHGKRLVHRVVYENMVGPIPDGLVLDHLCRNRACVNPDHLEPVTHAENMKRAGLARTHCKNGHLFDEENAYRRPGAEHRRLCRRCNALAAARYRARKAA